MRHNGGNNAELVYERFQRVTKTEFVDEHEDIDHDQGNGDDRR